MTIPVCRPLLPTAETLVPYLARVDGARFYTNYGQLNDELTGRLAAFYGLEPQDAVLASNGTVAIIGAILAQAGRAQGGRDLCICPSYTFVATAVAAARCGYEPFLADVEPDAWALAPERLAGLPELERTGVVIAVAPYGRKPDLDGWQRFVASTGVPVVIDAAACFDTIDKAELARSRLPVVISLHATKTFSTAEGGLILSRDADFIRRATRALNFGFFEGRESIGPSINGKLSEYHAAVGLADLDRWETKRAGFLATARSYREAAEACGLAETIIADAEHASPYVLFLGGDAAEARHVEEALAAAGIDTRKWYGLGLHHQPAFRACGHMQLPVTDDLAPRLVGLPCAMDLEDRIVRQIVETIAAARSAQPADFR